MKYIRTKDGYIIDLTKCANPNFFNSMAIKQADTIEELIQDDDLALWFKIKVYCDDYYYEYLIKDVLMLVKDAKIIASMGFSGHFDIKDIKELYIKDKQGNYIKVAERKDEKGEMELL